MTIDLSTLQIPDVSVVPEPTADEWEDFEAIVSEPANETYYSDCEILQKISCSLARRCRKLEAVVANYESIVDQTKSAARIAELEAEVERLKNMLESIRFLCGFDTEADAWAAVRKGATK